MMENPIYKWMITRGTPILGNPHMFIMFHDFPVPEVAALATDETWHKFEIRLVGGASRAW